MSDTQLLPATLEVKVNGNALSEDEWSLLLSVEVDQRLSAIDRLEIVFDDTQMIDSSSNAPVYSMGAAVSASVVDEGGSEVQVFTGEITAVSTQWRSGVSTLSYEAMDNRNRLIRTLAPITQLKTKLTDKLQAMGSDMGLSTKIDGTLSTIVFDAINLAATDWETLCRIEHMTGSTSFVNADDAFEVCRLDNMPTVEIDSKDQLVSFEVRWSPVERTEKVKILGWDQAEGKLISGETSTNSVIPAIGMATGASDFTVGSYQDSSVRATSPTHADELAAGAARRFRAQEIRGRGRLLPTGLVRPGVKLKISGVNSNFNGTYALSAVRHHFDQYGLTTDFEFGPPDTRIADALQDGTHHTPGLTVGVVTNIDDPDKRGRAKVSLPLLGDKIETDWLRILTFGAATDRGIAFIPEVGDEVIVGFVHGDVDQGYVLGTVWNKVGKAVADAVVGGAVEERRITGSLGNRLRLIDKSSGDDESGLMLEVSDGAHKLFIGYNKTELVTDGKPIEITDGEASIKIDKGKVTIDASEITLKSASGKVVVDANAIDAKAKGNVDITANGNITGKATAMMTLEGSSMTTIKGGTVKVN